MHSLDSILALAQQLGAKDIHLQPAKDPLNPLTVILRDNRRLLQREELCPQEAKKLWAYLQFHSGYLYEKSDNFQDHSFYYAGCFLRLAFTPAHSPYLSIRLASMTENSFNYPNMLFDVLEKWRHAGGMIIIAGPIHSGKTTLYYECLQRCSTEQATISSWEDPIERQISGLNQFLLESHELSKLKNAALRFDWDILGLGEVRDLSHLEALCFLSLSSIRTITTVHARSLIALQEKFRSLPTGLLKQLSEACFGFLFCSMKGCIEWHENSIT